MRGKAKLTHAAIGNMAGPGSCRFLERPKVGDLWVLYIRSDAIAFKLPIEDAQRIDPTLSQVLLQPERERTSVQDWSPLVGDLGEPASFSQISLV